MHDRSLLEHWFNIPGDKIVLAPFYFHDHQINPFPKDLDARRHFVTIGNFRHSPNEDSVFWLKERIWPKIKTEMKKRLNEKINSRDGQDRDESTHVDYSNIECHVYGAFPAKKHMNLTNKKEGKIEHDITW